MEITREKVLGWAKEFSILFLRNVALWNPITFLFVRGRETFVMRHLLWAIFTTFMGVFMVIATGPEVEGFSFVTPSPPNAIAYALGFYFTAGLLAWGESFESAGATQTLIRFAVLGFLALAIGFVLAAFGVHIDLSEPTFNETPLLIGAFLLVIATLPYVIIQLKENLPRWPYSTAKKE